VTAPQWVRAPLRDPLPTAGDDELNVRKGHRSMSVFCDLIGEARPVRDPGQGQDGLAALRRGDGPAQRAPPRAIAAFNPAGDTEPFHHGLRG
jgi:hypothetical protein